MRSSPSQNLLWVCFSFSLALPFILTIPPKAHYEHQKSNTVQQGLMLSDSTTESKAGLLGKSGDSLWDILSEKGAGVMGGEGTAAGHNTMTGNDTASEGRRTWSWQRWHFGAPQRTCACCAKAPGADHVVEQRLGGLEAAGSEGWLTLERLHCFGS